MTRAGLAGVALGLVVALSGGSGPDRANGPERRALDFLAREVPRWGRENRCYSCHNNGDAARALYEAKRRSIAVAPTALADTTAWLARPERWDHNGGDGPFSDKLLARVQFASALAAAAASGSLDDRAPLRIAADRLAKDQAADGSWPIASGDEGVGSPAGYGRPLATLSARETLLAADPTRHRDALARADRWLLARPLNSTLDAAVALQISVGKPEAVTLQRRALARVGDGQSKEGGWGPFADTAPEPFDTALILLALARLDPTPEVRAMLRRGRHYLAAVQQPDGSWPETTRPANAESYAQRISTTGWATLALLATRDVER